MKLYPFRFEPIYKEKIWGGQRLRNVYGRDIPADRGIGESWEIADHGEDVGRVSGGDLNGVSLRDLMLKWPEEILGKAIASRHFSRFPLLVKLIDASDRLSVQVHPTDEYASKNECGECGKTEMWYVAHADKGAELICGLKADVSRGSFERSLNQGELERCLNSIPVKNGDVVFIPAGRIHAIGAGNLILEIQENSDVTYRVYDWNRLGNDGKPRPLHIEKAIEVIDFEDRPDALVAREWKDGDGFRRAHLVKCRYFDTEQIDISGAWGAACDGQRFQVISIVDGRGKLYYDGGRECVDVRAGDNILLPASLGEYELVASDGGCAVLKTEVP